MKLISSVAIATAALLSASAANAGGTITWPSTQPIPAVNDFKSELNGLGLWVYASTGASISVDPNSAIDFYFLGSESAFDNTFSTNGATPTSLTETSLFEDHFASPIFIGTDYFAAGGSLAGLLNFSTNGVGGASATVGDPGFGIFLGDVGSAGTQGVSQFYLGYDDSPVTGDDNHDDFVVLGVIRAVPEPATWAMMLLGFGGIGLTMRRRNSNTKFAQVA